MGYQESYVTTKEQKDFSECQIHWKRFLFSIWSNAGRNYYVR